MGRRLAVAAVLVLGAGSAACAGDAAPSAGHSPAFDALVALATPGRWRSTGDDRIEVWVCRVPADSTSAVYGGLPLRLAITPQSVTAVVSSRVPAYFAAISHGAYRPEFVPGGEVTMGAHDEPQACVDHAIAGAAPSTRAVLVVADAEHADGQPGGFGSGGDPCPTAGPCAESVARRAAYVGASDFDPDWGGSAPMDLVEHELGHTLGWVHSGYDASAAQPYRSALDVMSNSAAPRDTDPSRRDAPDTLAIDRVMAGWLPLTDVTVAPASGAHVVLSPSTGVSGTRLLVLPVDANTFLTVERLTPDGFDAHLPSAGIAVHRVRLVGGELQPLEPLVGAPPYTALLAPGGSLRSDRWRIAVDAGGEVTAQPAQ